MQVQDSGGPAGMKSFRHRTPIRSWHQDNSKGGDPCLLRSSIPGKMGGIMLYEF